MKAASQKMFVKLALVTLMAAGFSLAPAQAAAQTSMAKGTPAPMVTARLQATANQAEARINAAPIEKKAMVKAAETKNTDMAKAILLRSGFTDGELENAMIMFRSKLPPGGGPAEKVKVTISASCCPMKITITLSF
jgi:hypothetical protein